MISSNMMIGLQQAMNRLWFQWKKLSDDPKNFGVEDKQVIEIENDLNEVAEKIEKLVEGK